MGAIKYTAIITLVVGMLIATWAIPNTIVNKEPITPTETKERTWNLESWGTLGDLDSSYSAGNSTILGVWVVNHSSNPEVWMDGINNTAGTEINASNTEYGYAQGSSFDIEIPHSTAVDLLIYVRANDTNAATGSAATDQFNDTWVMVNFTSADLGCSGGVNLSGIITKNTSGDPAMYMLFIFNGTGTGIKLLNGWNRAMCGSGFSIIRDNRSFITSIKLLCYY